MPRPTGRPASPRLAIAKLLDSSQEPRSHFVVLLLATSQGCCRFPAETYSAPAPRAVPTLLRCPAAASQQAEAAAPGKAPAGTATSRAGHRKGQRRPRQWRRQQLEEEAAAVEEAAAAQQASARGCHDAPRARSLGEG